MKIPSLILSWVLCMVVVATPAEAQAPAAATLTRDQLIESISRQLVERLQLRGELQLDLQRAWVNPAAVPGGIEAVIVECPAKLSPSLMLRVRLQTASGSLGDQMIPLHAQLLREVYVARSPVAWETTFDVSQFDTRRVDTLRERDAVAVDDCAGEYSMAANVQAGRLLLWRDLKRRALVRKGQVIEVTAVDGTMTITAKALAMENGAAGDSIRVRNLTSQKDFTACVIAEARAQVRF